MIIYGLQTVKSFNVTFALKVTLLCRFALELSSHTLTMIILSSFKVTSTIYLFYNLCRFALELSTNILTMIFLSFFKVTSTIYLFYNLCRCIFVLSYSRYKHINNNLSFYLQGNLYFLFCSLNILVPGILSTKLFAITFFYLQV